MHFRKLISKNKMYVVAEASTSIKALFGDFFEIGQILRGFEYTKCGSFNFSFLKGQK